MGFGRFKKVLLLGMSVWILLKFVACIFMSMCISNLIGFEDWSWWLSSILFFCILARFIFSKSSFDEYEDLIKNSNNEEEL